MHPKQVAILALATLAFSAQATITVTPQEMAEKTQWVQQNLLTASTLPPFSFTYNGVSSSVLLPTWSRSETDTVLDTNRTQHLIVWSNNLLQVSCVAIEYNDYPLVEWTVYMTNIGGATTPVIQNIQGLNTTITRTNGPEFVLNGNQGDSATPSSFEPYQITLTPSSVNSYSPPSDSGKSCDTSGWPYYNLQTPGGGMIVAIGWPGQWASSFTRDSGNDLQIQAGQQRTVLVLNPGEQIRAPLIALMFWQGTNVVRSQNIWRHWYMAHVIPRVNGQPPSSILQVQGDNIGVVDAYLSAGIHPDILWRDAGAGGTTWYPSAVGPYSGANAWLNTGTWVVDTNVYPHGFLATSQAANAVGTKFLLWFEPERVGNTNSSFLATNNPSWLLPGTSTTVGAILNEGNPGAFNWLTNHIEHLIISNGIDWYREDMNGNGPLPAWQNNDAPNRQGITENFYVQGHLAYWDALLAMNPGLRIDCCGSGGRRVDLEAMQRAVPLTRSDYVGVTTLESADGEQCQTYGLSSWLPFQGVGCGLFDPYSFRSSYVASFGLNYIGGEIQPNQQSYGECKIISPIMLNGDYYPLTPYSQADTVWMAWQFDWPDNNEGCVQIFRRTNSPVPSMTFQLQGLNPAQTYDVQDFDTGDLGWYAGSNLMTAGITLQLNVRQSAILYYTNAVGIRVSASASPQFGFPPLSVQFAATPFALSGASVTYAWDFDDGGASTNQNPTHIYYAGGKYLAQVTAMDGLGNSNTTQVAIVVARPQKTMGIGFTGYSRSGTLTNFPVLVEFGPNLSPDGFSYSQMASSNGWDLLFMSPGQTQPLNYEIERWNTNGTSYVWVQAPLLTSNVDLQVYWGDTNLAATPAPSLTNGSVWANGYVSVWHLGETNGTAYDSTANHDIGSVFTTYGSCTDDVAGVVGNGYDFGGGYVSASASALPGGSSPRTVSTWFMKSTAVTASPGEEIIGYGDNLVNGDRFGLWISGNGTAAYALGVEDQGEAITFPWTSDGNWHYLEAVLPDGQTNLSAVGLYYDGIASTSATGSGPIDTLQDELCFAGIPGFHTTNVSYSFGGDLDEIRISDVARSSNWIWAEYMNMASNAVFNSYGAVTSYVPPLSSVRLTIASSGDNVVISWPTNVVTGAVLQASSNLVNWTDSTLPVVPNGTNDTVTVQPNAADSFYRLGE